MDGRSYNQLSAKRLEQLFLELDPNELKEAMNEVAVAAEAGGPVDNSNEPRRSAPWVFAMDLLLEKPMASDWINCRMSFMPNPSRMTEIWEIADWLK